jgi:hypothetical protein
MQRAGLQQHERARGRKQQQRDLDWLRWGLLGGVLRAGGMRVVGTCAVAVVSRSGQRTKGTLRPASGRLN